MTTLTLRLLNRFSFDGLEITEEEEEEATPARRGLLLALLLLLLLLTEGGSPTGVCGAELSVLPICVTCKFVVD